MNQDAVNEERLSDEQAIALNAFVFLAVYAIIHWLTDDEFNEKYEQLVVVFGVLRVLVGFGIIMPDKKQNRNSGRQRRRRR